MRSESPHIWEGSISAGHAWPQGCGSPTGHCTGFGGQDKEITFFLGFSAGLLC